MASIVAVHPNFTPQGGRGITCYLGRFSSQWLNRLNYNGRSDWTPAETVCSTAATVEATINGTSLGSQSISDVPGDVNRGILTWALPGGLPPGKHTAVFTITAGGNGIEQSVTMAVAIALPGFERVVTTSCYYNGYLTDAIDIEAVTGVPGDNATATSGPLNGAGAPVFRNMTADKPTIWVHIDDWFYGGIINSANYWGSPASLTDNVNDDPIRLYNVANVGQGLGFVNSIQNANPARTASIGNQGWYAHAESAIRRPEVQAFIKETGAFFCKQLGDNEYINDGNPAWWVVRYNPVTSGSDRFSDMSSGGGNPYVTAAFDPTDFSVVANATAQAEANLVWRTFRAAWEMYTGQFNPPLLTDAANVPWIVRELQASANPDASYNADDYVPFSWQLDLGHTQITSPDFLTCSDLITIEASNLNSNITQTNTFISRLSGNTQFNTGGSPRSIESPLGTAQDAVFLSLLQDAADKGKNIFLASPKEFGSQAGGNKDALPRTFVNWVDNIVNTVIPGLPVNVVLAGGDQHWLTAWKTNSFLQVGMSPCTGIGSSSSTAQEGMDLYTEFNMPFPTNYADLRVPCSWENGLVGYDLYRYGHAKFVFSPAGIEAEGIDNRGENFLNTQLVQDSGISATGSNLSLLGALTMAIKTWKSYGSPILTENGPNNPGICMGQQLLAQTDGYGGSEGFPLTLDSNGIDEVVVVGIAERGANVIGVITELGIDYVLSNAVGFTEFDTTTRPSGEVLPRSASIRFENVVTGIAYTISSLSGWAKTIGNSAPKIVSAANANLAYQNQLLTNNEFVAAIAGLKGIIKSATSTVANIFNVSSVFSGVTESETYLSNVVASGDIIVMCPASSTFLGTALEYYSASGGYDDIANTIPINETPATGNQAGFIFEPEYVWTQASTSNTTLTHTASSALPAKNMSAALQNALSVGLIELYVPETGLRAIATESSSNSIEFRAVKQAGLRGGSQAYDIAAGETVLLMASVEISVSIDDAAIAGGGGGGSFGIRRSIQNFRQIDVDVEFPQV